MTAAGAQVVSSEDEPLMVVDGDDQVVDIVAKGRAHDGHGLLHRAFSVFLFDADGNVLLQQRSAHKRLWPLYWSNTCCSHPHPGEAVEAAGHRRLRQELGLSAQLRFLYKFTYQADFGQAGAEHEMCSVFVGRLEGPPAPNRLEIAATRLMAPAEVDGALAAQPGCYTPWMHLEWERLRRAHWAACRGC